MKTQRLSKFAVTLFVVSSLIQSCTHTQDGATPPANSMMGYDELPPTQVEQQGRDIYAIGDVHGDLNVVIAILTKLGLIDAAHNWIGGKTIVVQIGDQLDKGVDNGDRDVIEFFDKLHNEAPNTGGAVYSLLGNHEFYNLTYSFKKVSNPGAFSAFARFAEPASPRVRYGVNSPALLPPDSELKSYMSKDPTGRLNALKPGGRFANILAKRPVVLIIGDSVFVHSSLLPDDLKYGDGLVAMNADTHEWVLGYDKEPSVKTIAIFNFLKNDMSPIFDEKSTSADQVNPSYCKAFGQVLTTLHLKRIIKGHNEQFAGVNSVCDGKVWRIDVGLSAHFNTDRKFHERWQILKIPKDGTEPQIIK